MISRISQAVTKRVVLFSVAAVFIIWIVAVALPNIGHRNQVSDDDDSSTTLAGSFLPNWSWGQGEDMKEPETNPPLDPLDVKTQPEMDAGPLTVVSTATNIITHTKTVTETPASTMVNNVFETVIPEIHHHTKVNNAANAKYLVLVVTRGEGPWGHAEGVGRDINGFIDFIKNKSGFPLEEISFAVSTASENAYKNYISVLSEQPFAKSQVVLYEPQDHVDEPGNRHAPEYQAVRRQQIAFARNLLMLRALGDEQHIFWYDSDVVWSEQGIAAKMLQHSLNGTNSVTSNKALIRGEVLPVGLITTRSTAGGIQDYDLNAWAIRTDAPIPFQRSEQSTAHMKELTDLTTNEEIFPLDAVGGVVLYMRASLVRKGLNFPSYYVVGTTWDNGNGGDGLETEGLCYVAMTMGYACYGLGGGWHVDHGH